MSLDEILEQWIPYRLQAIETLLFAWDLLREPDTPRRVDVLIEGKLLLRGNAATIANPMIEAGVLHARALLEFMGLAAKDGRLAQIPRRRADDVAIEHFSCNGRRLPIVTPDMVLDAYPGPCDDGERALVAIFTLANKGMAHICAGDGWGDFGDTHVEIACRGIPVLINNHLYAKLGRPLPAPPSAVPA